MKLKHMKENVYKGKLIVFCGVDGAGKTTLLNEARAVLESNGIGCYCTKMPSNRIRQMGVFRDFHDSHDPSIRRRISAMALTVLVSGDRLIVQETEVIPALQRGEWVLCDRYAFSGLACCCNETIIDLASEFIRPDLAFLASASSEKVKERVLSREDEKDRFYDEDATIKKMRIFQDIADNNEFFITINTENELESVKEQVRAAMQKLIEK